MRDYYGQQVEPDEQTAIRCQVDFLRRAGGRFPRAVEYGCGPTLMRALAASPYVESLDMADWLDGNLQHVRRWADDRQGDDWSHFTEYVLRCEGIDEPKREAVLAREGRTRQVLSEFLLTDAREPYPLGPERAGSYDLLISGFCLDCLSPSKTVWRSCMCHVFGLLKPGGSFFLAALRGCDGYRVGHRWFPGANIQLNDMQSALLECQADPANLVVTEHELPTHAAQGYTGMLLATGNVGFSGRFAGGVACRGLQGRSSPVWLGDGTSARLFGGRPGRIV